MNDAAAPHLGVVKAAPVYRHLVVVAACGWGQGSRSAPTRVPERCELALLAICLSQRPAGAGALRELELCLQAMRVILSRIAFLAEKGHAALKGLYVSAEESRHPSPSHISWQ